MIHAEAESEAQAIILDPALPIIDAHHHLFRRPALTYLLDDYVADIRAGHNVVASVYVEAGAFLRADGPEALRPLGEVEFANGAAAMSASGLYGPARVAAAIVGHADLRLGGEVARLLDEAAQIAPDRYRGIRQVALDHPSDTPFRFMPARPPAGILSHPLFIEGLRTVATRRLVFDTAVFHHQLPDLCAVADAVPEATIVLNHAGMALGMDLDANGRRGVFQDWRRSLREIAQRPNVLCKIGGFGMWYWGFDLPPDGAAPDGHLALAEIWRPYVETALTAFGPQRCMMESNFPIDGRAVPFVTLWNAYKHIVATLCPEDRHDLFCNTAARVYRIEAAQTRDRDEA